MLKEIGDVSQINHYIKRAKDKSKELVGVKAAVVRIKERGMLPQGGWLEVNHELLTATFKKMPEKDEIGAVINDQLIVEFYRR